MAGYFGRLLDALLARAPAADAPTSDVELRAQLAGVKMDLQERDRQIGAIQREYAALQSARDRAAADGGQQQLERLYEKLAGPLSNLAALADLSESGQQVAARDFAHLIRSIENELARAGMERVGAVGEVSSFDPAIHQRMSGGTVHLGTSVIVRLPGYRMGEKVLMKAMVTTKEADHE